MEDAQMKSVLMVSVAAAALSLAGAAPGFAACSDEIAQLKSQTFTGSVGSGNTGNQTNAVQPLPTDTATNGQTTAAATPAETTGTANTGANSNPMPDQTASASANTDQATGTAASPASNGAATASAAASSANAGGASNPIPDQTASAGTGTDQSTGKPGMDAQQTAAANNAGAGNVVPDQGGTPAAGSVPGTEATAAMNAATTGQGIAASPAEVKTQQTAQPAETAPKPEQVATAGNNASAASAAPTSGGEALDMKATLLARADAYQKLGNEGACMNLIDQAKKLTQ